MTSPGPPAAPPTTCYRHPDRSAGVRCQRCDRNICPACMNTASVGFHCPECFQAGRQRIHTGATMFHRPPVVTQVLIALNVAVFAVSVLMGDGLIGDAAIDGLLIEGALNGFLVGARDEWYRVLTSGFLHFGVFHLAFNMYALWILGPQAEQSLGRLRFALVYAFGLVAGSLGAMVEAPGALSAGASGAIFGLFGLAVVNQRSLGRSIWDTGLGPILVLNFILTFGLREISVGGHVGGFLGGLLAGAVIYYLPRRVRLPRGAQEVVLAVAAVACFFGTIAAADASL